MYSTDDILYLFDIKDFTNKCVEMNKFLMMVYFDDLRVLFKYL